MKFSITKLIVVLGLALVSTQSQTKFISNKVGKLDKTSKFKRVQLKDHFCSLIEVEKLFCNVKGKDACKAETTPSGPACAFDKLGVKYDFNRQCEVCEVEGVKYYFRGTCNNTPAICHPHEECINGLCIEMLNEKKFDNAQECNVDEDCSNPMHLCVANKCVDKMLIPKLVKQTEKKHHEIDLLGIAVEKAIEKQHQMEEEKGAVEQQKK